MRFFVRHCIVLVLAIFSTIECNFYSKKKQLPFVIHVCSFNNKKWVEKNLDSIFAQKYDNFRVIYVDDQSEDQTAQAVQAYIDAHGCSHKLTLIANNKRQRKLKNMYDTIRLCDDNEIIVQVDGDDWLCDPHLLARLNHLYQSQDIWLTYGSYNDYPSGERGYCQPTPQEWIEKKLFRSRKWLYMHPRSFYAWLFKMIHVEDHITELVKGHQGVFYPSADDQSSFWPMLEMAGHRFAYLPEITYICNRGNPLSGRVYESPLQRACGGDARKRSAYKTLDKPCLGYADKFAKSTASLMVISNNSAHSARKFLKEVNGSVTGISHVALIYTADQKKECAEYEKLTLDYPSVTFIKSQKNEIFDTIHQHLNKVTEKYVVIAFDAVSINDDINITKYIQDLETTHAYGVYFGLGLSGPPFAFKENDQRSINYVHLYDEVYAWKFACGEYALFNNLDFSLFRKCDFIQRVKHLAKQHKAVKNSINYLEIVYSDIKMNLHKIGLFCDYCPVISDQIPNYASIPLPAVLKKHPSFKFSEKVELIIDKAMKKHLKREEARKKSHKKKPSDKKVATQLLSLPC